MLQVPPPVYTRLFKDRFELGWALKEVGRNEQQQVQRRADHCDLGGAGGRGFHGGRVPPTRYPQYDLLPTPQSPSVISHTTNGVCVRLEAQIA